MIVNMSIEYSAEEIRELVIADCMAKLKCPEGFHFKAGRLYSGVTVFTEKDDTLLDGTLLADGAEQCISPEPVPAQAISLSEPDQDGRV